ncbi:MAG: glycosyltransferase family 2 protein [Acidobacteria bacterium]|jgi:glycosyltransferase involved in cell wall biosynthesis|nr:glycosyltransferase family 2 protein [Acidobacteriota bacterium]
MALLSVVLSFRNEAPLIPELIARVTAALATTGCTHELIFIDDASTDGSGDILAAHAAADSRIKVITMARAFGPSECVLAGLRHARGDAAVFMDTDLQDPPELLPTLVTCWQDGTDVVHTIRTSRVGESSVKMAMTRLAYRLIRAVADIDLRVEAGDYKLLSRRAVDAVLTLPETDPYLRGLAVWVGFRQQYVPYARAPRASGVTHFPFFSTNPWRTVLSGLTSFSVTPLLIWAPLGVLVLLAGLGALVWTLMHAATSWQWVLVTVLLLAGVQLIGLGVLGLYLARVYRDGRRRPPYIIAGTIGLTDRSPHPPDHV